MSHPEADLLNSLVPDPDDQQALAIEEVLKAADEYEPPVSVIRQLHEQMKAAGARGRAEGEARRRAEEEKP